jgi:nitroreductase
MPKTDLYPFIFKRRSVRDYRNEPLPENTIDDIRSFSQTIAPLLPDIKVQIDIRGSEGIKGLLRSNAPHYISFYSEAKEGYLPNAGFMLQQLDLYLSSNGIGNCYQGLAKSKDRSDAPSGKEFVIMTSFGQPAENQWRSRPGDFKRRPLSEISTVKGMEDIMEAARVAPSAANNQSWYFTGGDRNINAYYEKSVLSGRMNQINVGIALCHMAVAAEHFGKKIEFVFDPAAQKENIKGHVYVISAKVE